MRRMRQSLLLAVTLLAFAPTGCGDGTNDPRMTATAPIALRYQVEGMHCDGCVQAITDKVKHVQGVVDCRVSLAERQADVVVRDDATALPVQQAIEKLGYKVKPLPAPDAGAAPATR
jgi:copper chaperone CopZ